MIALAAIHRWLFVMLLACGAAPTLAGQVSFDSSHGLLNAVLKQHLSGGSVDYAALVQDRRALDDYLATTATVSEETFDGWTKEDQLAFLINLYNASTLRLIRDHYPVVSIRKIGGFFTSPWKLDCIQLWGRSFSLDEVEHDLIRKRFAEPRIHFALVCAAKGCPPLRATAYVGTTLDADLDQQGRLFMAQASKNRIDRQAGVLWLSPIFHWYGRDFTRDGKTLAEAVSPWLGPDDAAYLKSNRLKVRFTEYDWALNDTPKP